MERSVTVISSKGDVLNKDEELFCSYLAKDIQDLAMKYRNFYMTFFWNEKGKKIVVKVNGGEIRTFAIDKTDVGDIKNGKKE